jgi:hypothetical protein
MRLLTTFIILSRGLVDTISKQRQCQPFQMHNYYGDFDRVLFSISPHRKSKSVTCLLTTFIMLSRGLVDTISKQRQCQPFQMHNYYGDFDRVLFSISPHRKSKSVTAQLILWLMLPSSSEYDPLLVDYCNEYLKDRFNYEYLILRFGYPSHFAGTNNCE